MRRIIICVLLLIYFTAQHTANAKRKNESKIKIDKNKISQDFKDSCKHPGTTDVDPKGEEAAIFLKAMKDKKSLPKKVEPLQHRVNFIFGGILQTFLKKSKKYSKSSKKQQFTALLFCNDSKYSAENNFRLHVISQLLVYVRVLKENGYENGIQTNLTNIENKVFQLICQLKQYLTSHNIPTEKILQSVHLRLKHFTFNNVDNYKIIDSMSTFFKNTFKGDDIILVPTNHHCGKKVKKSHKPEKSQKKSQKKM